MATITIDGIDEHEFRHSIEDMLRLDQVDEAITRLRLLLEPYAGSGRILPQRFLDISSDQVEFTGWHKLTTRLGYHDRPNHPISAIGVTLADARILGGPGPSGGRLPPFIKTFYFSDDAYPFSDATRDDLLDGYTREGFGWQGDYQATDATLQVKGIDDLHGAIVELEDKLFDNPNPSEEAFRAGAIGACYLAALIHQSLRDTIRLQSLPRPLCVFAACDGVYPFFDAPVAGSDECTAAEPVADSAADSAPDSADAIPEDVWPNELEDAVPADEDEPAEVLIGEGSLLTVMSRKGTKSPVLVLADEDAWEAARLSDIAGAEQLVADTDGVLARPLLGTHASHPTALNLLDHDAGPELMSAMITGSRSKPVVGGGVVVEAPQECPADLPETASVPACPDEPDRAVETDGPVAELSETPDSAAALPDLLDDSAAAGAPPTAEPVILTGHSLRTRINLARPIANAPTRQWIWVIVERFRNWVFGR